MKKILLLILLFPMFGVSQTYFGSIAVPADNGTSATSPVSFANPPIASMVAGDLVIVILYARNATATFGINNTGGQTWTTETAHQGSTATLSAVVLWCRYNGAWSAAPSFTFSSTTNTNAVMHVFRPTSGTKEWAKDPLAASGTTSNTFVSYAAPGSAIVNMFTFTPQNNNNVTIFMTMTDDDNSWSLSAAGTPTSTQVTSPASFFRNTSGSDASSVYSYVIQSTAAAFSAAVNFTQTVNNNDPGIKGSWTFYEYSVITRNANSDFFKVFNKR